MTAQDKIRLLFSAQRLLSVPRFCNGCTHFKPHDTLPEAYGFCTKQHKTNLVDGSIEYPRTARHARDRLCQGRWWEPKKPTTTSDDEANVSY